MGRTDAKAETPIHWPPDVKSQLIGKDPDAGKYWRQEKGTTEDETAGWHHWLDGYEFEQTPGDGKGQESLACCRPWGHKESDTTERLNKHPLWGPGFIYAFLLHPRVGCPQAWVKTFPSNLCALPLQSLAMFLPGKRARNSFKAKKPHAPRCPRLHQTSTLTIWKQPKGPNKKGMFSFSETSAKLSQK